MNQQDRFNVIYKNLTEGEQLLVESIKAFAGALSNLYNINNREMSLALTNLEQSVMWAVKGVCANHASE